MHYHQKQYPFYNPELIRMSLGNSDFTVNYVDLLDESCVEFLHVHEDSYEIYYCLEGTQHLIVGEECCTMTAGTFLLLRPGVRHYTLYEPQSPKKYTVFVFAPPSAVGGRGKGKAGGTEDEFVSSALRYFDTAAYFLGQDQFLARAVLDDLHRELAYPTAGHHLMVSALYQQYLISILRCLLQTYEHSVLPQPSAPTKINLAIAMTKYMHANYYKNITVQDISNEFYISPRHVNRVFEDYFGQSLKRTLNIYRLNYAKNYLIDTDYSTEKIAELVGLSSSKVLSQLFREVEGTSLSEFRKQHSKRV